MRLIHGDCLIEMDKLIQEGVKVDLTFTSPPYNMRTRVRNGKYTERETGEHFSKKYSNFSDCLAIGDYYDFHKKALEKMMEMSDIVLWNISIVTGSKEAIFRIIGDFHKQIKDIIVWDKGSGQPAMHSGILNRASELIIIFKKDAKAGRYLEKYKFGRGTVCDIWRIKPTRSTIKGHGAVFPIGLVNKAIDCFTDEGEIVFDPFMGSGTTGVACKNTGRDFIGIELDKEYFQIAEKRINEATSLFVEED